MPLQTSMLALADGLANGLGLFRRPLRPEALLGVPDAMLASERDRIAAFAIKSGIPSFSTARENAA